MMHNANPNTTNGSVATTATQPTSNPFPTTVFPEVIQQFIHAAEKQDISKNFLGLAIMSAASTAIGNSYNVEEIIRVVPIIFGAFVGSSSTGKTPAMSLAFTPIYKQEIINEDEYKQEYDEYLLELAEWKQLPAKLRGEWNKPKEPKLKEVLINDFTPEALIDSLASNPKSLLYQKDELIGIINSSKGNLEESLITVWDNLKWKYKTKGRGHEIIDKPFLNIIGGIQPKVLSSFSKGNRNFNGFIFRFLFAVYEKPDYTFIQKIDATLISKYETVLENLLSMEVDVDSLGRRNPNVLYFESEASEYYQMWRAEFKQDFTSGDDAQESIVKKLENYSLRFALILQLLYWAAGEEDKDCIGMRAVEGAIMLSEHYKQSAQIVQNEIAGASRPKPHEHKDAILDMLSRNIRWKEIESTFGVSSKTIARIKVEAQNEREQFERNY